MKACPLQKKIISRQSKQQAKFYALKDPLLFYNIWNSFLIYMCTTVTCISTQVILIPRHCRYDLQKNFCFSKIYHFEIIHLWHFDTYCGIFVLNKQFATFIFLSYENLIRPHLQGRYIFLHWRINLNYKDKPAQPLGQRSY